MNGNHQIPRPPVPRHKIPLKSGKTLAHWMQDKQKVITNINLNSFLSLIIILNFSFLGLQYLNSLGKRLKNTVP